jgi:adenylate cyclase class 1
MTRNETSIEKLAADIRTCRTTSLCADAPDLAKTVDAFVDAASNNGDAPFTPIALGEATLNLFRLAQASSDGSTLRSCLRGMLRAGRFGRILAARTIHAMTISLREMAAVVAPLPARDRLALAHEMMADFASALDKPMTSWLETLVRPLADTAPEELVPFLADLGESGQPLAFPVRQVVMNGRLGKWVKTRLETGASDQELDQLCRVVVALDSPAHAETLAVSMAVGFITPTPLALRTVTALAEAGSKPVLDLYLKILKSSSRLDGGLLLVAPCLDGIMAQKSQAAGKLMATIRMKMPSMRKALNSRVPLLGEARYTAYLDALPKDRRTAAEVEGFAALLALAPDFVEGVTRAGTARGRIAPEAESASSAARDQGEPEQSCRNRPGFLARLFKPRPKTLEKMLPKVRNLRDMDLPCSRVTNEELDGRELTAVNLANSTFADVSFLRCKVAGSTLTRCGFTNGSATGCTFHNVDFSGSDLTGMAFSKCSFNDCEFSGAAFSNCILSECSFRNCVLGGAAFLGVKLVQTGFTTTTFAQATFFDTQARSCRFEDSEFTGTDFTTCQFKGVEFVQCVIQTARFEGCAFHAVTMQGTTVNACSQSNTDAPHALFLADRIRQITRRADRLEHEPLPGADMVPPEVAGKVMRLWSQELTFLRREERMQGINRKRLAQATKRLEREKQAYLRMLPHLLDTDIFEKHFGLGGVPACEVWGHTPSLSAIELARHYFPKSKPSKDKPRVRILAVYAMGSLGTVAQTAQSDIDCWVCFDGDIDLDTETGLKRKLDALGLWAESEFGLEAHFFPMRMDDVRDNKFSSGDEESSGSAQALLLKEEFYRTAVRISGKHLAWWVIPAGADKKTYAACIQAVRRYPITGRPRLEDFGHLAPVPPDEYFGGSLWQMVKAIHSPFKSVLKLGLLETYAAPDTSHLPLCDRIKHNLFMNRRGVRRTDPYASLFSTLRAYYVAQGDKEAARLLTESFKFKANLCDIQFFLGFPARAEDASLVATLFGKGYVAPDTICNTDEAWTFEKSLKMGGSVRRYMVATYERIQSALSADGSTGAMINAQDLTRMGRRIAANFSPKPSKIMRVPFMDAAGGNFAILHFSAQKAPGKKPVWVVRGGSRAESKKSSGALQLLHRSGDPVHMLAWLLANRLYNPKSLLQADRTVAPISVADLQKLMPAMHEFFPFDQTFERDINEGLSPERVTRAFFIFNLTAAPDARRIEQAAVIYSTNWGELFCRTFSRPGPLLERHPSKFLADNLPHPVTDIPEMILFIPKGSQCKRINLI